MTQVVTKLRKALGDTAREPNYIEAISKRGYRLIAAVERQEQRQAPAEATDHDAQRRPSPRWIVAGALAALVVAAAVWPILRPANDEVSSPRLSRPRHLRRPSCRR